MEDEPGTAPIGAKSMASSRGVMGWRVRKPRNHWKRCQRPHMEGHMIFPSSRGMNQPGSATGIGDSIVSKVSTWRGGVTVNACEPHLLFRAGLSW